MLNVVAAVVLVRYMIDSFGYARNMYMYFLYLILNVYIYFHYSVWAGIAHSV